MQIPTTPGRILLKHILPEDTHHLLEETDLTETGIETLMLEIAEKHPEQYRDILNDLNQFGGDVAATFGDIASLDLDSLIPPKIVDEIRSIARDNIFAVLQDPTIPLPQKKVDILNLMEQTRADIEEELLKGFEGTPFGTQALSGVKGGIGQATDIIAGEIFALDEDHEMLPYMLDRGYIEGLLPSQYWLSAQKARSGLVGVKLATPEAGDLAKQLMDATHRIRVTTEHENLREGIGIPANLDNPDFEGSVVSQTIEGIATAGDKLTASMMEELKDGGYENILVHSPITSFVDDGISRDALGDSTDVRIDLGEFVGIIASQSLTERICLEENTEVLMSDGTERKIKDIKPGEEVFGCSKEGIVEPTKVTDRIHCGERLCKEYTFTTGTGKSGKENTLTIKCTPQHEILSGLRTRQKPIVEDNAEVAPIGRKYNKSAYFYALLPEAFKDGDRKARLNKLETTVGVVDTYDLTVEHPDHLFVLANGLVVSNTQKAIGSKHGGTQRHPGLEILNRLISVPKTFRDKAALAPLTGRVKSISELEDGSHEITVGSEIVRALPEKNILVSEGDQVRTGDALSDGLPNPAELVQLLGIGAGRKKFANILSEKLEENRVSHNSRWSEVIARGLINHVRVTDRFSGYFPGDLLEYMDAVSYWEPEEKAEEKTSLAKGKYLTRPAAYHMPGTLVTEDMIGDLESFGIDSLEVTSETPPFEFEQRWARGSLEAAKDPFLRLYGSSAKKNTLEALFRGKASVDLDRPTSFIAQLATSGFTRPLKDETNYADLVAVSERDLDQLFEA